MLATTETSVVWPTVGGPPTVAPPSKKHSVLASKRRYPECGVHSGSHGAGVMARLCCLLMLLCRQHMPRWKAFLEAKVPGKALSCTLLLDCAVPTSHWAALCP